MLWLVSSLPLRVPKEEQRQGRRPEAKAACSVGMQRLLRWKQQNPDKALHSAQQRSG